MQLDCDWSSVPDLEATEDLQGGHCGHLQQGKEIKDMANISGFFFIKIMVEYKFWKYIYVYYILLYIYIYIFITIIYLYLLCKKDPLFLPNTLEGWI